MNEIKEYINRFFKQKKMNIRYSMTIRDCQSIKKAFEYNAWDAVSITFDYGYVKGYRAAMAEMKKGVK